MLALFYLCFWLWWRLTSVHCNCIQISVSLFLLCPPGLPFFLTNSQFSQSVRHCGITYGTSKAGQGNNQLWKGPERSEDLIQSQRQRHHVWFWLDLAGSTQFIFCGLGWRLTPWPWGSVLTKVGRGGVSELFIVGPKNINIIFGKRHG